MAGEHAFAKTVCSRLRGLGFDVQRHEDALSAGIPDLSYACGGADGWVELKSIGAWPKQEETPVRLGVRTEQVNWLERRGRTGSGRVFLFARVGSDQTFLLFHWHAVRAVAAGLPAAALRAEADRVWRARMNWPQLSDALRSDRTS